MKPVTIHRLRRRESGVHPSLFITEHYDGLDQIVQAIDDMKERKAIKIAVKM